MKGLTKSEVAKRVKEGKVNGNFAVHTKTIWQIIFSNVFTLFNLVNLTLALCLIWVESYRNILFMGVVFWNILIGVVQEIRSKAIIDKLSLLSTSKATVLRDEKEKQIDIEHIVIDDIIMFRNGNQVSVDSCIIEGECEVNESLLTGESDPVYKKPGDEVLSGSFLISGKVYAKVIHIGKENYVNRITSQAKYVKKPNSQMFSSIRTIIKIISIVLIPMTALLFYNQYQTRGFNEAVVGTVAAVIGMIPSGLVLLTSMVLAVSVIRLGKQRTLVQELYCIETLARVDVLCLDKTGTITQGTMSVEDVVVIDRNVDEESDAKKVKVSEALYEFTRCLEDDNPTFEAIWDYAGKNLDIFRSNREKFGEALSKIPFSSDKKWSAVDFKDKGLYVIGALEFIFKEPSLYVKSIVDEYAKKGMRVLVLAHSKEHINGNTLPEGLEIQALILVSDKIRKEAPKTFEYFKNQGVTIKVISGDNPATVAYVAKKAGLLNTDKYIDATLLDTDEDIKDAAEKYTIFGRVTPMQKFKLVKALKEFGHTVAMTGDGVNDVLALKESDCSIAMQSGSDAARNVSQLVLMDSNFSAMPHIVAEGRRTINNIQRSASLYLTKTIYSTILAFIFVVFPMAFPFIPIQLTLVGSLAIGIPSFVLAMEPNLNRVKGNFLVNVLKMSIPGGTLVVANVVISQVYGLILSAGVEKTSTLSLYALAMAALIQLVKICKPFNRIRRVMCLGSIIVFVTAAVFFKDLFVFARLGIIDSMFLCGLFIGSIALYRIFSVVVEKAMGNTPNIYSLNMLYSEGTGIVLVEDDVDEKDYMDVASQMKGVRLLNADKVAYIKSPKQGGDIRIENSDKIFDINSLIGAARYYLKKKKIKDNKAEVLVETLGRENPIKVIIDKKEHMSYVYAEGNTAKKIRYLKKIKITF